MSSCENCKSTDNYVDDRMGEVVCNSCGYVMVSNIYEETMSVKELTSKLEGSHLTRNPDRGTLGSFIDNKGIKDNTSRRLHRTHKRFRGRQDQSLMRGHLEMNMILSPYLPNNTLKDRAQHYYKQMFYDRIMTGYNIDVRACAICLIVLRENGIPITIAELAQTNNLHPSRVSKCARKFARHIKKPYVLHSMPIDPWVNRVIHDLKQVRNVDDDFSKDIRLVVDYIHNFVTVREITFTKSFMASALWIAVSLRAIGNKTEFTQKQIGDVCNCTSVSIRTRNKETYSMLNITKESLVKLTVEQFLAGVRYE